MTHENAADAESARDALPLKPAIPAYKREHLERVGELCELMAGHKVTIESRRIPHPSGNGNSMDSKWNAAALHCAFEVFHNGRKVYSDEYSAGLGAAWPDTLKEFGEAVKRGRRALPGLVMIFPGEVACAFKEGWQGRKVCDEPTVECFKAGWRPDPVDIMQSLLASVTDESFADWCSNLGYEEDSRRAHATWTSCRELDRVCRAMFGRDFEDANRIAMEF